MIKTHFAIQFFLDEFDPKTKKWVHKVVTVYENPFLRYF